MQITSPKKFALYRAGEFVELSVQFILSANELSPQSIFARVGNRIIPLEVELIGQNTLGFIYKASAQYRLGFGLKRFVFLSVSDKGGESNIGTRLIGVGSEDIGPSVFIPANSEKLPLGINVIGSLNYEFGLGEAARGMVQAVQHAGIATNAILAPMVRNSSKCVDFDYTSIGRSLEYKINLFNLNAPDMQLVRKRWPRVFTNGQYNIGYWYYELPRLPSTWFEGFNGLNEIWVASRFVYDAIKLVSPIPVYLIPPVVNVSEPSAVKKSEFGLPPERFCVLSIFDLNSYRQRKNPEAAIAAFNQAYTHNNNLHLVLKVNNSIRNPSCLLELRNQLKGNRNVTLITEVFPRSVLTRLQAACDVFISLHRSEGFGLNLAECMALGKPVIATNWSANTDYMNSANSCPVNFTLTEIKDSVGPYEKGQIWAEPCIEHAAQKLVEISVNVTLVEKITINAMKTISIQYGIDSVASLVKKRHDLIGI